ncbi:MAG TPA: hypothetical protein VFN53_09450 [Acidobacteriaceae bacterium]|nr:hypothetical protein [Acidobacteriaceae bacterium]
MFNLNDEFAEGQDEFERELRAGLRPRSAPDGFAERINLLAAAPGPVLGHSKPTRLQDARTSVVRNAWTRMVAAACLLLIVIAGTLVEHEREQRHAGERARAQVMLALRVTSTALQDVRMKVDNPRSTGKTQREP